jgi:hypothetical protein
MEGHDDISARPKGKLFKGKTQQVASSISSDGFVELNM